MLGDALYAIHQRAQTEGPHHVGQMRESCSGAPGLGPAHSSRLRLPVNAGVERHKSSGLRHPWRKPGLSLWLLVLTLAESGPSWYKQ